MPAQTLKEYVKLSRNQQNGITYASSGHGTHVHLMAELFQSLSGANLVHVPYSGGGPAMADLVAGHVASALVTLGTVSQYVRNGQVRLLAVASPQRIRDFPNVPTFAELGYKDFDAQTFTGLFAPAGTAPEIVTKLHDTMVDVLKDASVKEKFEKLGAEAVAMTPAEFTAYLEREDAKWTPVVRAANIKAD